MQTGTFMGTLEALRQQGIEIPKPNDVRDYLLRYPDMVQVLPTVCDKIAGLADAASRLSLEVYRDPEINDRYLTIYVRRASYDGQIGECLEHIRDAVRADLERSTGWLHVTTDFR